ncbi:Wbp11 domain containing protein [Pyrenophora tritici-repentis]|uniref:Wbp11 multi-domain protein n=1 Tax=Pyrenophora tritici-repentis TaxID=45151 RepID=A0A2W1DAS5_9PLEO|nr:Wbp11 multi-domain protein [Pyrenophora tritici-repentis]KAF7570612.1 Wbp11 multi-domain protein [Pyrenophora tritici-repentis]KAI1538360.1 Wbp11 domain containing protein [Pyrenophora tritici-repentis]KAI1589954.1 Wbp11 domain containing protein [Pyrenophora tritici-repentis]KAI1601645.1 Wbp11 domain containing protein [Pyrenophora tritici-repentis]
MPKEKNYNPVQEAKKAEKQKQLRKQKANLQTQRNEKLARRNPNRLQRDIENLKELDQNGSIRPHERQRLQELEKDLAAVNKARAALGDKAPVFKPERRFDNDDRGERGDRGGRGGSRDGGVLGKRTRDGHRKADDSSDTDDDVKHIPMPRDTPPPIPRHYQARDPQTEEAPQEPKKPTIVYEAAPQVRNLLKEATRFMPASVAQKVKLAKGEGRLLEPEEFDKLREEGYMDENKARAESKGAEEDDELEAFLKSTSGGEMAEKAAEAAVQEAEYDMMAAEAKGQMRGISKEAAVAENTLKHVEIEEVEDEDL